MADKAFTIDLTNYKDRRGQRVEPGKVLVTVEDAEQNTSKTGNPYITTWLRVLDGADEGATILDRLVLTEKSLWRVVSFLNAVGIPTPRKRVSVPYRALIGRRLVVEVEDGDPYNGTVRSEVRGYHKAPGSDAPAQESTDLADLGSDEEAAPAETAAEPASEPETVAEPAEAAPSPEPAPKAESDAESVTVDGGSMSLDDIDL